MSFGRVTDHQARGLALLTSHFRGKKNVEGLLRAYLRQVQEIEDAGWQVLLRRVLAWDTSISVPWDGTSGSDPITDATGQHLDFLGMLVGLPRQGRSDADYAGAIRLQIRLNRANGLADDIIQIARLSAGNSAHVVYTEGGIAAAQVGISPFSPAVRSIAKNLRKAKAGGVSLDILLGVAGEDSFLWGTETGADASGSWGTDTGADAPSAWGVSL